MNRANWWTRLSVALRPGMRQAGAGEDLPPAGEDGLLADGALSSDRDDEPEAAASERALGRWPKRDQTLQQLHEGYQRVTELVDALQRHATLQGDRTERIAASLDQVARTLADLPAASREQARTLDAIGANLEMTNSRAQQLAESIRDLPGATKAQGEALVGLSRQFEMANETTVQLNHTLQMLGQAVGALRDLGEAPARSLQEFRVDSVHREGRLAEVISGQQRRFTRLFVVTLIFAVTGAIGSVIVALRVLSR